MTHVSHVKDATRKTEDLMCGAGHDVVMCDTVDGTTEVQEACKDVVKDPLMASSNENEGEQGEDGGHDNEGVLRDEQSSRAADTDDTADQAPTVEEGTHRNDAVDEEEENDAFSPIRASIPKSPTEDEIEDPTEEQLESFIAPL